MNQIEELMARSLDEQLTASQQQALDEAMYQSTELMRMQAELAMIKDLAARDTPPCPQGVFLRIQEQVDQAYAKPRRSWFFLQISKPALALAAMLILAMAFLVLRQPLPNSETNLSLETLQLDVSVAQQQYHEAIGRMELAAVRRLETLPPQMAIVFAHNLHEINRAIAQCEQLLGQQKHDPLLYQHLGRAYAAKADLLTSLLAI